MTIQCCPRSTEDHFAAFASRQLKSRDTEHDHAAHLGPTLPVLARRGKVLSGQAAGQHAARQADLGDSAEAKMLDRGGRRCRSRSVTERCQDTVGLPGSWAPLDGSRLRSSALPLAPGFLRMPPLALGEPPCACAGDALSVCAACAPRPASRAADFKATNICVKGVAVLTKSLTASLPRKEFGLYRDPVWSRQAG